jgi:hypothetical protein
MRREWRNVLAISILFQWGTSAAIAQLQTPTEAIGSGDEVVRLTIELNWTMPQKGSVLPGEGINSGAAGADSDLVLELTAGWIIDAIAWAPEGSGTGAAPAPASSGQGPGPNGSWRLGKDREGRVRVRLEAPLEAGLVVRCGDQLVNVPLVAVLERPQHTPPQSRLTVSVERLAWDSLAVDLGDPGRDGVVAPGTVVPVSIGFNILSPESMEVAVRTTAVIRPLRGGDALWRSESREREIIPANRREPPTKTLSLRAPETEGTYVLEVRASWEQTGSREGSRLGRLIRRRKPAAVMNSAVRRVVLTVLDPHTRPAAAVVREARGREAEVDAIDLARARSYRPLATGRSPPAGPGQCAWAVPPEALIEPSRRDRLRGWIMRTGAEAAKLDPADPSGLAWTAVGLKVAHPERPHRLTLKIRGGEPSALGVALIEPGAGPGSQPRVVLDACASGPPILPDGPSAAFTWIVWPAAAEIVLVLVNRGPDADVRLGNVTLTELDDLPLASTQPEPRVPAGRGLGLHLSGPHALDPFGGGPGSRDALVTALNLVTYLGYCRATAVVLPEDMADRSIRRSLESQADEDPTGPDRLDIVRRVLARNGYSMWLELEFDGTDALPGLPAVDSAEALRRGLVRVDPQGRADGPAYHPLHPEVREAMKRRVTRALTSHRNGLNGSGKTTSGLVIRLGSGPTLLGTPDTGMDDGTFALFVRETFSPDTARTIPGLGNTDADRFAVRSRYLAGVGRMPWLTWRVRAVAALYTELAEAAQAASPGSILAVVTPGLDGGPAGNEARRVDRAGLAPSQAWRSVGLDLQAWPSGPFAPRVLRGAALSTDALAHDLATSSDLDRLVAARAHRGLFLTIDGGPPPPTRPGTASPSQDTPVEPSSTSPFSRRIYINDAPWPSRAALDASARSTNPRSSGQSVWLTALPLGDGPAAAEPLGHALAALDAQWVFLAGKAVAGQEERVRRFAGVLRALPAWATVPKRVGADPDPRPFGIAVREMSDDAQTFLEIANDSPYPIRLAGLLDVPASAPIDDLGRGLRLSPVPEAGGRNLVLDVLPFGVAAIRVGAPHVTLSRVTPYPSEAVLADMQARFNELTAQLARLNHGLGAIAAEPANPGFEPEAITDSSLPHGRSAEPSGSAGPPTSVDAVRVPSGWNVECNTTSKAAITIDRENPHSGQGSLRLVAPAASASAVSDAFVPSTQSGLTIRACLRAAAAGAKVRVWIEGASDGHPYIRQTELTVGTEWEEHAVRASDIPAGGLDTARVRFELLAAGTLWIDDLRVLGESNSKSARLNAQRTLLAALQAYREQRYADFARLAGSHWIRESNVAANRLARATDVLPKADGPVKQPTDGSASALPSERKLR